MLLLVDKIQEIFTAPWAIADNDYYRLLSLLVPCVAAGNLDAIEKRLDNNKITAYATTPYLANRWELDDETLPADSVAVIILEGTLYSWETYRLEKQLRDVFDNPKICGAVLWINGPGGMVAHVDLAAKMIAESSKPIATYVAGTMGSAHFWLGTAAGRTFIASPMCEVGSVGIMLTYQSFKKYFKKQGIEFKLSTKVTGASVEGDKAILTIEPLPCTTIRDAKARTMLKVPVRLTAITSSKSLPLIAS